MRRSHVFPFPTSQGRRDEVPKQELAECTAHTGDREAVRELIALLDHLDKDIRSDCIKVLYEIGERRPALLDGHAAAFAGGCVTIPFRDHPGHGYRRKRVERVITRMEKMK